MNRTGTAPFQGQTFFDDSGVPLADGYLKTTLAGVATLAATFSDVALTTPNPNSNTLASTLRLDSSGRAESPMYFDPCNGGLAGVQYDLYIYDSNQVLVQTIEDIIVPVPSASGNATSLVTGYGTPTTLTIAGGSITPTMNDHKISPEGGASDNLDNIAITGLPDGAPLILSNTNGSAPITIRTVGNIHTPDGNSIVLSSINQRQIFVRDGSAWYLVGSSTAPVVDNAICNFRLTLTSGSPVVNSVTGTTLYWTPYGGNRVSLYNGTAWEILSSSELNLSQPAAGVYDIFAYNNSGTVALQYGTAWTTNFVRAVGIVLQDGVYVKSGDATKRYVGTVSATPSFLDTPAYRGIWNYYNRVDRPLLVNDTSTSSYNTALYRQANGNAANQVTAMVGVLEDAMALQVNAMATTATAGDRAFVSISTGTVGPPYTPMANVIGESSGTAPAAGYINWQARYNGLPILGLSNYLWIERGSANGAIVWQYTVDSTLINFGMSGTIKG